MEKVYRIWDSFFREKRAKRVKGIIKKYNMPLVRAICSRVNYAMAIGIDLMDINVIPERMYHEFSKTVNNPDPMADMIFASTLMSRVRRTLYEDPHCFPVIMNAFRKHSLLNEVVVLMEKEYYADTITIGPINTFVVSFFLGAVIGAIFFFIILWPFTSSSPIEVQCTEGTEKKLLLKLTSNFTFTSTNYESSFNLTDCILQYHYQKGGSLLEYYHTLCNTNSTNTSSISNNDTSDFVQQWCTVVETIYDKLNVTVNGSEGDSDSDGDGDSDDGDSDHSDGDSLTDEGRDRTWCYNDLTLLLNCLNI